MVVKALHFHVANQGLSSRRDSLKIMPHVHAHVCACPKSHKEYGEEGTAVWPSP